MDIPHNTTVKEQIMSSMEYQEAIEIVEAIINKHCEKLRSEAELLESFGARRTALQQIDAIKDAFNKVRNG